MARTPEGTKSIICFCLHLLLILPVDAFSQVTDYILGPYCRDGDLSYQGSRKRQNSSDARENLQSVSVNLSISVCMSESLHASPHSKLDAYTWLRFLVRRTVCTQAKRKYPHTHANMWENVPCTYAYTCVYTYMHAYMSETFVCIPCVLCVSMALCAA